MSIKVLLISTYEMGRQPFGLASPAAWLRRAGARVTCLDLSRGKLDEDAVRDANIVAFYVPMHMATRLAAKAAESVRRLSPQAHLCYYGLYAPVNAAYLHSIGAQTILGGEFEEGLERLVRHFGKRLQASGLVGLPTRPVWPGTRGAAPESMISLGRQQFIVPDRSGLPPLKSYAQLETGNGRARVTGYTEASRGCKHLCRHCPIVPVYNGVFRIVQPDVVLADIAAQVAAGAEHITFGDPDFLNGPRHALDIVRGLHREFPALTYDVTIKIEHLRKHADLIPVLKETGCLFVTSAVESVDDRILEKLDKGHTLADFREVVRALREIGLPLAPTFVPFTPWTTAAGYCGLLHEIADLGLVENVAPIQLAIRLLIPAGSLLLELPEIQELTRGRFDAAGLNYRWQHPDPAMDQLAAEVQRRVWLDEKAGRSRSAIFAHIWELAAPSAPLPQPHFQRTSVPYLNEPWYC